MKLCIMLIICLFSHVGFAQPPREIPPHLIREYTMNGLVPILQLYLDDSYPPSEPKFFSRATINSYIEKVQMKHAYYYGETDLWLYELLEKYPIRGKDVVIIGSVLPWYESIILAFGGRPTTIEYNKIITDDERLTILTVDEYNASPKKFDVLITISSIENSGLGRYGDPINPNGDLEFMKQAKEHFLKENGTMILAVPVGKDCLVWNAHRIYGRTRLPLLIKDWTIIDSFGFHQEGFSLPLGEYNYQPVFYLSPKRFG